MGAADRLRLRLVEQGTEIEPHPIYERAAIANLRWTDMDHCLDHFTAWFSLVPDYDQSNPPTAPGPFSDTRHVLIHSGWPSARLPLILRFGIICASKGYLQPVLREILPLVVRFASANDGVRWFYEMEQAAVEYQSIHHPMEGEETARRYRAFTINLCCQEGWLDHAMAIVQLERSFSLPTSTYNLLIQTLQDAGRLDNVKDIERCFTYDTSQAPLPDSGEPEPLPFPHSLPDRWKPSTEIVGDSESPISQSPPPLAAPGLDISTTTHDPVVEDLKDVQKSTLSRQSVSEELRSFKCLLRNRSCPDPFHIVRFLSDFKTVGGSQRVVAWLRHRALSSGKSRGIKWIRAELRYHNVERNYDEILRLYLTYLKADIPGTFGYTLTRIASQNQFNIVPSPSPSPKYTLLDRWLVLKPIILLALDLPWPLATIQALYASYNAVATKKASPFTREPNEILSAFIAAFGECSSPGDATRVLRDCGDAPYLRQVETLAGVLARAGKVGQAMRLLERIEDGAEDGGKGKGKGKKDRKGMRVKGYDGKVEVALPRLTTYGRMIEGFTEARLLKPALEVERRMMRRLKYEYGQGTKLDEAMTKLWALEMERAGKPTRPSIHG